MIVRSINIARDGDYGYGAVDASKPFRCKIKVGGVNGEIELLLSTEMSQQILALIADEVAAAGRATAQAMVAEVFNVTALPGPEGS